MSHPQETILPSVDKLNAFEHGRFVLSNIASKRAKQLKDGAPALVDMPSIHPLSLALGEIASHKIKSILKPEAQEEEKEILHEGSVGPAQLGLLLPSLDDLDIPSSLLPEEDFEVKQEINEINEMSLDELLLEEDPIIETDQLTQDELGTISLNELEDQENTEDNKDLD